MFASNSEADGSETAVRAVAALDMYSGYIQLFGGVKFRLLLFSVPHAFHTNKSFSISIFYQVHIDPKDRQYLEHFCMYLE